MAGAELLPMTLFEWIKMEHDILDSNYRTKYKAAALNRLSGNIFQFLRKILMSNEEDTEQLFIKGMKELINDPTRNGNETEIMDLMIISPFFELLIRKVINWKKVNQSRAQNQPKVDPERKIYHLNSALFKQSTNNNKIENSSIDTNANIVDIQDDDDDEPIIHFPKRQETNIKSSKKHKTKVDNCGLETAAGYTANETLIESESFSKEHIHQNIKVNKISDSVSIGVQSTIVEKETNNKQHQEEEDDRYLRSSLREKTLEDLFLADNNLNNETNKPEPINQDKIKQEILSEQDDEEFQSETELSESRQDECESDKEEEGHAIKEEGEISEEDNAIINNFNDDEKGAEYAGDSNEDDEPMAVSDDDSEDVQNEQGNITSPLPEDIQQDENAVDEQAKISRPTEYEIPPLRKPNESREKNANLQRLSTTSVVPQSPSPLNPSEKPVHNVLETIYSSVVLDLNHAKVIQANIHAKRRKRKLNDQLNKNGKIISNSDANLSSTSASIAAANESSPEQYSEHSVPPWYKVAIHSKMLASESVTPQQSTNLSRGIKKYTRAGYESMKKAKRVASRKKMKVRFVIEKNTTQTFEIDEDHSTIRKSKTQSERVQIPPCVNTKFMKGLLVSDKLNGNGPHRHRQLTAQIQSDIKSLIDKIRNQKNKVNQQNRDSASENDTGQFSEQMLLSSRLFITDSMLCNLDESVFRNMVFLRLNSHKNMDMLIEFGLIEQCQHILNNLSNFEFSYVFLFYGYDLISQHERVPSVDYILRIQEWFNKHLADRELVKSTEDGYVYQYTLPQFVLITIPELGPYENRIREFNEELRKFLSANGNYNGDGSNENSKYCSFHLIDWATMIKTNNPAPKTDEDAVKLLIRELNTYYGVLAR